MAKKHIELEDGTRIGRLSGLRDFQVAEGYTDIRGWRVEAADGKEVGRVSELLVDLDSMRTRYVEVRLNSLAAAAEGDRDVLIPVGAARVADNADKVVVPLTYDRVSLLPAYEHPHLTRSLESELRRHFALGEAASAGIKQELRVPVQPEDSVVLKRGENGHDEIIVRRPEA
jgi:photosynthetic reaction center H subunit